MQSYHVKAKMCLYVSPFFGENLMKIKNILLLVAAICPMSSCMSSANDLSLKPVIAGGYGDAEINEEIKKIALFAVQTQSNREKRPLELVEISKAMQQVVAGMNYRLELTVKSAETQYRATAVVFRSLNATYELTSWQWLPAETTK